MFFAAYAKEEPNLTIDIANSTFALANIRVRTANASQDVIAANALISPLVYSGAVELRSNDYATYLMALGGISAANTAILNLQGGLANTNITALTGGLAGANTAIALRALAASPTFTGNATFDTNTLFVDSLNDRVGIGTSSLSSKFTVTQEQAALSYLLDTYNTTNGGSSVWRMITRNIANTGTTSVDFYKPSGSGFSLINNDTNAANFTAFGVGSTERMRIDSSGNVGIGTASPSYPITVSRSGVNTYLYQYDGTGAMVTGSDGAGLGISGTFSNTAMAFFSNSSERMRIDTSGNIGIGTSSPAYKLDVRGTANVGALTISGTVTTSSLTLTAGGGIEGGQLDFANAVTNTTIATGIAIDIYGDKIRFFEKGGTNRGAYIDLSASLAGVGSNLLSSSGGGSGVPVASIIMYGANTAPAGWLVCDGAAVSRSTYAALFAVVSNVFGIGDNTTTFNLPDFRGRSPYGVDASQSITIGASSVGKINASFQNSTGTGTSGSGGPTTHSVTTVAYQQPVLVKDQATNGLVTAVAAHTAHTHTIPALTVDHPAEVVQFIIKT